MAVGYKGAVEYKGAVDIDLERAVSQAFLVAPWCPLDFRGLARKGRLTSPVLAKVRFGFVDPLWVSAGHGFRQKYRIRCGLLGPKIEHDPSLLPAG